MEERGKGESEAKVRKGVSLVRCMSSLCLWYSLLFSGLFCLFWFVCVFVPYLEWQLMRQDAPDEVADVA